MLADGWELVVSSTSKFWSELGGLRLAPDYTSRVIGWEGLGGTSQQPASSRKFVLNTINMIVSVCERKISHDLESFGSGI